MLRSGDGGKSRGKSKAGGSAVGTNSAWVRIPVSGAEGAAAELGSPENHRAYEGALAGASRERVL